MLSKTTALLPAVKDVDPSGAVSGLSQFVNAWKEHQLVCEQHKTERSRIAADRDVHISAIREQAGILQSLLQNTFRERAVNFQNYFDMLNQGLDDGDDKRVEAALALIVEQTRVSPVAQAAQLIQQINDKNIDYIEI